MVKKTSVILECDALGRREFGVPHAERLLGMRNNGGWRLPDDSGYEYDTEHGIRRKRHKGGDNAGGEERRD